MTSYCTDWLIGPDDTELWNHQNNAINVDDSQANICNVLRAPHSKLRMPSFQRGIEWSFDTSCDCITSSSPTLGIVVLGNALVTPDTD